MKKYWFNCEKCGHPFNKTLGNITYNNQWCPYCSKKTKELCDDEDCKICEEKSFASHEMIVSWSSKNTKSPRKVLRFTKKEYFFECKTCFHEFYVSPRDGKVSCPYCCIPSKKLCEKSKCRYCKKKSFDLHPKAKYWSSSNDDLPRDVHMGSGKERWFLCDVCDHEFCIAIVEITREKDSRWCPICAKLQRQVCNSEDCDKCKKASFASHPRASFWSKKNTVSPREVIKGAIGKYLFVCEKGHEFSAALRHVSGDNQWCPTCKNKGETKLFNEVSKHYKLQNSCRFEWCKAENGYFMPFDFCLAKHKIIIEVDGDQHFKQVSNWEPPEKRQEADKFKMKQANRNGYSVIRVLQTDVFRDKNDWLVKVLNAIAKIVKKGGIRNIYVSSDDKYLAYMD